MKRLNAMYHLDGERLIKSSNNQEVDVGTEPIFILRARDYLAAPTIWKYLEYMIQNHCDFMRVEQVMHVYRRFLDFQQDHADKMKQPGITKGR